MRSLLQCVLGLALIAPMGFVLTGCRADAPHERGAAAPDTTIADFPLEEQGDPPVFEDFPATTVLAGPPAAPDLSTDPRARSFRTALTRGAAAGANFAGHHAAVLWGCGNECREVGVVDLRTGRVHVAPFVIQLGVDFRPDSRLFVVNPPAMVEQARREGMTAARYATRFYEWDGERFQPLDTLAIAP